MPPFLMLIFVAFAVIMVMFGSNPLDEWKEEQRKYGKDPLAREINKFNEEQSKKSKVQKYVPPPGATVYKVPAAQAQIQRDNPYTIKGEEDKAVRPAPDVPMQYWGSQYAPHMLSPGQQQSGFRNLPNHMIPDRNVNSDGGTSLVPNMGGTVNRQ